jgi:hypothetical protein
MKIPPLVWYLIAFRACLLVFGTVILPFLKELGHVFVVLDAHKKLHERE